MKDYRLDHLSYLESEAIYIFREVAARFENPFILFSGGKDSILLVHLAIKAFSPAPLPFRLLHIDTGHNFSETIKFRDELVNKFNLEIFIGSVQDAIDEGKLIEETGIHASRNLLQTEVLLDQIETLKIDAAIGGGRRDEEKARAKERIFSHRDEFGQWSPKNQRAELWNLYNSQMNPGEHFRIFPLSNWTELDVWEYLQREEIDIPSLYFAHERKVIKRDDQILADSDYLNKSEKDIEFIEKVRCRTIGDMTCTGLWVSEASTIEEIVVEVSQATLTERGGRSDDKRSDSAMEDRKKSGYF